MVWEFIQEGLQKHLADNIYRLWIAPLQFAGIENSTLTLKSPDKYISAYVRNHFAEEIIGLLAEAGIENGEVCFYEEQRLIQPSLPDCEEFNGSKSKRKNGAKREIKMQPTFVDEVIQFSSQPNQVKPVNRKMNSPKNYTSHTGQMPRLPLVPVNNSRLRSLNPKYTFDGFMVGGSNALAASACRAMVESNDLGSCLYINSDTGLGKSHLTHAVAHKVFHESPLTRLHYLTAKQFSAEMVRGIQKKTMEDFKSKYQENCDILLIEDVHTLTGKKKTQEELNDVVDHLVKSGKRIIFTAKAAPKDLQGIDSEFCSRMSSGLITTIAAPDAATRCRIVENKAIQRNLRIPEEGIDYLGGHIRGDIRQIESALHGIQVRAMLTGGCVDMDMIREVANSIIGLHGPILNVEMIAELICAQFQVSVEDLQSRSRKKCISVPRQIAMYLARKHTKNSLTEIGRAFNRDHSTVLHSIKVVNEKLRRDTSMDAQISLLNDKVQRL